MAKRFVLCWVACLTLSPSLCLFAQTPKADENVSIIGVGDVMLGSWVIPILQREGVSYAFRETSPYLRSGDVAIANLEAPFTTDGEPFEKKFNFKVPPELASGLKEAGVSVVTLANNHIMDYGEIGLLSTIETLKNVQIQYCGAGRNLAEANQPAIVNIRGKTVAFFGYSMTFPTEFYAGPDSSGAAYPEPSLLQKTLTAWEQHVDYSVVSFHWSAEKLEIPKDYQIHFAHLAIDSGADLVLGHHPHVLQGFEIYKNRLIAYSLGNYVFGSYSEYATDSIILKVYLNDNGLFYAYCAPINVNNAEVEFQPRVLTGEKGRHVIQKLQKLSMDLNQGRNVITESGLIFGDWASFYEDWLMELALRTSF